LHGPRVLGKAPNTNTMRLLASLTAAAACSAALAQTPAGPEATSPVLERLGLKRCGTQVLDQGQWNFLPPGDCGNSTNPTAAYEPNQVLEITVVFHILRSNSGQGNVTDANVLEQIDVLNEDFRAIAGTNGQPGYDTQIQFKLATTDPSGNPTNGINRYNNTTWYNDSGNYWNSIAWDPDNYLNIYTNQASGALGYVPFLPHQGSVGSNADRVVSLWSAVGKNAPIGPPYNQGRTVTHEVGHYLGLYHTFQSGCGSSACYSSGDRICDTNPESQPHFGCGNNNSCGSPDPTTNYMDYSDDLCMNRFTQEQARRMRCTLTHWRPDLADVAGGGFSTTYCTSNLNSLGQMAQLTVTGSPVVSDNDLNFSVVNLPTSVFGYLLMSQAQGNVPFFGGSSGILCLGAPFIRFSGNVLNSGANGEIAFSPDVNNLPQGASFGPGSTWNFQYWYRDVVLFPTSNTSDALEITFQ